MVDVFLTDSNTGAAVGAFGTILHLDVIDAVENNPIDESTSTIILKQNYPNPVHNKTEIEFRIPESNFTSLKIYNLKGQEISTLVNDDMKPGSYKVRWDGRSFQGGVYYYTLKVGRFVKTRKLILLR